MTTLVGSPKEFCKSELNFLMATRRYAFGRADEATHPDSMRATLAEFASTFIFVFAGEGSGLALGLYIFQILVHTWHTLLLNGLLYVYMT